MVQIHLGPPKNIRKAARIGERLVLKTSGRKPSEFESLAFRQFKRRIVRVVYATCLLNKCPKGPLGSNPASSATFPLNLMAKCQTLNLDIVVRFHEGEPKREPYAN